MRNNHFDDYLLIIVAVILCFGFTSCGSDDDDKDDKDNIDTTPISLIAGDDKTILGADTISTSNRFVAYATKNVVHAWHVGEATLLVNGKKTISIKVSPKYYLYDDPICDWGCDMNYVRSKQKQGTLSSKSTSTLLVYDDAGAASTLAYSFENGKLKSVLAVVSTNHTSQYASYLAERYLMLPYYKGEDTYFVGSDHINLEDASTVVMMQVYTITQLVTIYMPAQDYSTSSRSVGNTDYIKEMTDDILKELRN